MNNCGLYIHIPFCKAKCSYCDFYSVCQNQSLKEDYFTAINKNIVTLVKEYNDKRFDSLFIGGGTPSVMGEMLPLIIDKALNSFNFLSENEVSVEVNPESVTDELMSSLSNVGVNRISMGVQTFNESQLKILGRIHTNSDVYNAVNSVVKSGIRNYNLDLMFALPVSDENMDPVSVWQNTVLKAMEYKPNHISAYSLTLEENTPLYKNINNYFFPTEQQEDNMYLFLCEQLGNNGFSHYEISNYAKVGYECKHNLKYWLHNEYLGIGPGAHSYINGKRYSVKSDINAYCNGNAYMEEYEQIDAFENTYERLITGLRLSSGINLLDFSMYYDIEKIAILAEIMQENGLVFIKNNILALTEKGFRVSNTIINQIDNYRKH